MEVGKTIKMARQQHGYTQKQLAEKVLVTRQAVSRWERGESEPSVDMRKLLALALEVPVTDLFDMPVPPFCECCGAPFNIPNMPFGTDADGAENRDYCKWCYDKGEFALDDMDLQIERNVPYYAKATGLSTEDAMSYLSVLLPTLKHWQVKEGD